MLKVGDKVIAFHGSFLTIGEVYTVLSIKNDSVRLLEVNKPYLTYRFDCFIHATELTIALS